MASLLQRSRAADATTPGDVALVGGALEVIGECQREGGCWRIGLRRWGDLWPGFGDYTTPVAYRYNGPFRPGADHASWLAVLAWGALLPLEETDRDGERFLAIGRAA